MSATFQHTAILQHTAKYVGAMSTHAPTYNATIIQCHDHTTAPTNSPVVSPTCQTCAGFALQLEWMRVAWAWHAKRSDLEPYRPTLLKLCSDVLCNLPAQMLLPGNWGSSVCLCDMLGKRKINCRGHRGFHSSAANEDSCGYPVKQIATPMMPICVPARFVPMD